MTKTAITSLTIRKEYRKNFGFHNKPASIPLHALITKLIRSPVKAVAIIEIKAKNPDKMPALFLIPTAMETKTQNRGKILQYNPQVPYLHKAK